MDNKNAYPYAKNHNELHEFWTVREDIIKVVDSVTVLILSFDTNRFP